MSESPKQSKIGTWLGGAVPSFWAELHILTAIALVFDGTEKWSRPLEAGALCVAAFCVTARPHQRWARWLWLGVASFALLARFPRGANHTNVTTLLVAVILLVEIWSLLRARSRESTDTVGSTNSDDAPSSTNSDDAPSSTDSRDAARPNDAPTPWLRRWFGEVSPESDQMAFSLGGPSLRGFAIAIYAIAGFHKLNTDFLFNAEVSCAGWFNSKLAAHLLGVKVEFSEEFTLFSAFIALAIEFGIALFLCTRWRVHIGIPLALFLHSVLALAVFYDFGAVMLIFLWVFLRTEITQRSHAIDVQTYAIFAIASTPATAVALGWSGFLWLGHVVQGAVWLAAANLLCFTLLWQKRKEERASRGGTMTGCDNPERPPSVHTQEEAGVHTQGRTLAVVVTVIWTVFALQNYVGLRTAGTLSMFSNVRTEGESNHLLIPFDHPFKASYQEDLVWVEKFGPKQTKGRQYEGNGVPRVEFDAYVLALQEAEAHGIDAILVYNGVRMEVEDLAYEWPIETSAFERGIFNFRIVQPPETPNICRW